MRPGRLEVAPPLPPGAHLRRPSRLLPFPLEEPGAAVFARARQGLWHGVRRLGVAPGDEALVPSYHHGSEIEALLRAGLFLRFYEAQETLEPSESELERLLGPRVRLLHLIHPLGLPRDAPRWRRWCEERGLLLIEDAAQCWLGSVAGEPVGRFGHLSIFSLYKTVPVPDGGAVLSAPPPGGRAGLGLRGVAGRHRSWAAQRWSVDERGRGGGPPAAAYSPERDFALGDPSTPASRSCRYLLRRVTDGRVAESRRANYRTLLGSLAERVPPPFDRLPDGASPMALPIVVGNRRAAIEGLGTRGVAALDLWSVPHPSLPVELFPGAAWRRASTIALPVHQGLRPADLNRIVDAVRAHA